MTGRAVLLVVPGRKDVSDVTAPPMGGHYARLETYRTNVKVDSSITGLWRGVSLKKGELRPLQRYYMDTLSTPFTTSRSTV